MRLSDGDEKNETSRFIVCLGAVIRRGEGEGSVGGRGCGCYEVAVGGLWLLWFENRRGINFCHCCCVPPRPIHIILVPT